MRSWPHTFSLPACASGSSIWPRAVIGHTEPRSLCFACRGLQYLIKNAQAVGLINLWDSNVRPKISAPLLPQWLHSHPNSHSTTLGTCSKKCYFMIFMWYVYPSLPFMCVCVCVFPHTPQWSISIPLKDCDYTSVFAVFYFIVNATVTVWLGLTSLVFQATVVGFSDWVNSGSVNK